MMSTLVAAVAMAALVIDIGQLLSVDAELQVVADLSAKSAARELARVYITAGREDPTTDALSTSERIRVTAAADQRGRRNSAGSVPISIASDDVEIGRWNMSTGGFDRTSLGVDAVRVRARRDATANGMVPLFFPAALGRSEAPLTAEAAARISGISYLPRGTADFPVAISKAWYAMHVSPCTTNNALTFYPTGSSEGCVGWHTFENEPANAFELGSILNGLRTGEFISPEVNIENTKFIFTGGVVSSALSDAEKLYNAKKDAKGELAVLIPVYDREDCTNPNGWIRIIGVARAVITKVELGGDKRIEARIECDVIDIGQSGGTDYGVLAAGPDLVR
jgi:hypothetical protein